jgi:hypothetical protein
VIRSGIQNQLSWRLMEGQIPHLESGNRLYMEENSHHSTTLNPLPPNSTKTRKTSPLKSSSTSLQATPMTIPSQASPTEKSLGTTPTDSPKTQTGNSRFHSMGQKRPPQHQSWWSLGSRPTRGHFWIRIFHSSHCRVQLWMLGISSSRRICSGSTAALKISVLYRGRCLLVRSPRRRCLQLRVLCRRPLQGCLIPLLFKMLILCLHI